MTTFKEYDIGIDIISGYSGEKLYFNTNDLNTAKLVITLSNKKQAVDLTNVNSVILALQKPDRTVSFLNCTVTDANNGIVSVILTTQSLAVAGTVNAEVYIDFGNDANGNDMAYSSHQFNFIVNAAIYSQGTIDSTNDLTALQQLLNGNSDFTVVSSVASLPVPSASIRFKKYAVQGVSGTSADALYICKMLSDGTYDWVQFA